MEILWHLGLNLAVIIGSITWAVHCFEERKPLLFSGFLLVLGIFTYALYIYLGYLDGACEALGAGGIWHRLVAIETCIDSYSFDLLFAQSAIMGSLLVWLAKAWGRRREH